MRGFSDDERAEIRSELVETASQLIAIHGFEKVTVQDVTEPVGIAESTFYRFFDSKADLYTEVLLRENKALFDAIEAEVSADSPPEERLERVLAVWAREFEARPLLVESHQSPQRMLRYMDEQTLERAMEQFAERAVPIVEDIQTDSDGLIAELDPMMVIHLFSVIELTVAQKELYERFGKAEFSGFQDALRMTLVRGLLAE
ncbi:TetR/AcrR family transcriptional regulator [Halapricum hydrolyticum]|uniref:TetR/AcrR family transcriptional regulator n=1 Tax=Halapricum hydrolyticum TaxID=2979991 RepID=A0AAE3IGU0_9EURY|nr:helix-turn-helix domain-containing protein [Halapricum hydrolyticum]MCU4719410.1 TetR/AcrR family transcriptional regulator [Halapricum hydrolyticum]MCU4728419.1 TetR/AcrR family transcriptional regulator [Halapricum hydrolyticum]